MILGICCLLVGCVTVNPGKRQTGRIEGQAGRTLPVYSFSVDVDYDQRLDNLVSGYKLLPVVVRNLSLSAIVMDARKDRWVVVGEKGKRYRAVNSLRLKDPVAWRELPGKMRSMIDYPEVVPINYSVTFDLLLPARAQLEYFREIRYYNAAWRQQFVIEKEY